VKQGVQPRASQRVAAVGTLSLFALLGLVALGLALTNLLPLLGVWVGIAVVFFALSFELRSSGTARAVWIGVAGTGALASVASLLWLARSSPWGLLGVAIAIAAVGSLGTYALRQHTPVGRPVSAEAPVLFVNPKSGGGKAADADIAEIAAQRGIHVRMLERGDDLTRLAFDAIADGADVIGVAGGDGSLGYVATATIDAGVPFVCIPAGTRNHFARDLGLDRTDIVGALDAFQGELRTIDYATVNGRIFLNVASLGLYAETVSNPAYRDAKVETMRETLRSLEASGEQFDLRFSDRNGQHHDSADLIMVSVGTYEISGRLADIGKRARVDSGRLGVITLSVPDAAATIKLATLWTAGAIDRFPGWDQWEQSSFEVGSGSTVSVGLDGETVSMEPPLRFDVHTGTFSVAVPRGTPYGPRVSPLGTAGSAGRLWAIAMGARPE